MVFHLTQGIGYRKLLNLRASLFIFGRTFTWIILRPFYAPICQRLQQSRPIFRVLGQRLIGCKRTRPHLFVHSNRVLPQRCTDAVDSVLNNFRPGTAALVEYRVIKGWPGYCNCSRG